MFSTELLFSNFVQCMDAARSSWLLPLSTADFRNRLPRAPCLGRLGHHAVCLELLMEGSQLPSNLCGFPFPPCPDFSEKGNEKLSVPYSPSPSYTRAACRGKRVIGSPWESAAWRRETGFGAITQGQKAILARSPSLSWTCSPPFPWDRARGEDAVGKA